MDRPIRRKIFVKSTIWNIAAAAMMAAAVVAPVSSAVAQQLEVWALSGPEGNYFEQALKRFEEANEGVSRKAPVGSSRPCEGW